SSSGATFPSLRAIVSARETSRTSVRFGRSACFSDGTGDAPSCGAECAASMKHCTTAGCSIPGRAEGAAAQSKRPGYSPRLVSCLVRAELLRGCDLGEQALVRLVGFLGEVGIELTELGRLGDETLIARFHVLALHLDRLLQ